MASSSSSSWLTFVILVIALIVAVVLLVYCIPSSSNASNAMAEEGYGDYSSAQYNEEDDEPQQNDSSAANSRGSQNSSPLGNNNAIQAAEPLGENEVPYPIQNQPNTASTPKDCFPKDQLTPQELLPADANSTWAQVVPAGQGSVGDQNFLTAGYHVGINTVGQTLRNANMQLRSEPPNPQVKVSPWMQSTIEPDTNRKGMEIGGC